MRKDYILLRKIKNRLPALKKLLKKINGHWYYEDIIYRFYHSSYKVGYIREMTSEMVDALMDLAPKGIEINSYFKEILNDSRKNRIKTTGWLKIHRSRLEAFFHAKYFLEMAVKYGKELDKAPQILPSGWAGLLYLYNMR